MRQAAAWREKQELDLDEDSAENYGDGQPPSPSGLKRG
jgi:hypothetical protein